MSLRAFFRRVLRERRWIPDADARGIHEETVRSRLGAQAAEPEAEERAPIPIDREGTES
jgi:hypothetical protein